MFIHAVTFLGSIGLIAQDFSQLDNFAKTKEQDTLMRVASKQLFTDIDTTYTHTIIENGTRAECMMHDSRLVLLSDPEETIGQSIHQLSTTTRATRPLLPTVGRLQWKSLNIRIRRDL
jgi:hypothetical protein